MKRIWDNPKVEVQQFVPQEYCKVCFDLHCNVPWDGSSATSYNPAYQGMLQVGTDSGGHRHKRMPMELAAAGIRIK